MSARAFASTVLRALARPRAPRIPNALAMPLVGTAVASVMCSAVVRADVVLPHRMPYEISRVYPHTAECLTRAAPADRGVRFEAPLDRIASVSAPDVTVRDAIERVAQVARLRLTYSPDWIPAQRRVCLAFDGISVGEMFSALLDGLPLRAIAVGGDHVVLSPIRVPAPVDTIEFARSSSVLDRVVVTGAPDGAPHRATIFGLEVIDGATLQSYGVTTMSQVFDLAVPGMFMWPTTPGALTAQYGSIRGASSFGATAPKVYLDGIEVANPLVVTQLDPTRLDRIEVIRGPQGAALYGADAISGVINIFTRVDGSSTGAREIHLSSSAGLSRTEFSSRNAFVHQHALTMRAGSGARTASGGVTFANIGSYVPSASERRFLAEGNTRLLSGPTMLTGLARLSVQSAQATASPLLAALDDSIGSQRIVQYTVGATGVVNTSERWTFTTIAGIDGFRVQGLSTASLPIPMSLAESLQSARSGADRLSLRLRGTSRYEVPGNGVATLTIAAEQALLRDASSEVLLDTASQPAGPQRPPIRARVLQSEIATNGGVSAQVNIAFADRLYLVAGGRLESTVGATTQPQSARMPMVGAAYAHDVGGATVKIRSGYGRGIRPAQSLMRGASWAGRVEVNLDHLLSPESQAGTEVGADVVWGNALSLHVTRFDQQATGLIQAVPVNIVQATPRPGLPPGDSMSPRRVAYALQNVGAISNRGWELEMNARWRQFAVVGWLSQVDSRITRVSAAYRGELRVGDRPLEVPTQTASLSVQWSHGRLNAATTVAHAGNWIAYDRIALANQLASREGEPELTGAQLRRFWRDYDGVTRVRTMLGFALFERTTLQVGGDNLLSVQRGAPDNAAVTPGRTITLGARTTF